MNKLSGVYMIVNKINRKRYVGSSENIYDRWKKHLGDLRKGIHHSILFQRAYYKYGEENFELIIMEEVKDRNQLVPREQTWLDFYKSYLPKNGYNINRIAGSPLGMKHSEATKAKIGLKSKGRHFSKETREQMSLDRKGEKHHMYGKHHSKETKERIRSSLKGKTLGKILSEEAKRKIRERQTGKHFSKETKNRMSIAHKEEKNPMYGKHHSEEAKRKMAEKAKQVWTIRKAEKNKIVAAG
jgi:group I intron endonuclease